MSDNTTNLTSYQIQQLREIVKYAKHIIYSEADPETLEAAFDIVTFAYNIYHGVDPFGGK